MGLKTKNYTVKSTGLFLNEAYCLVKETKTNREQMKVTAHIQQNRNSANDKNPLEIVEVCGKLDMALPVGEQSYALLKTRLRGDWEDDIIAEEEIEPKVFLEP